MGTHGKSEAAVNSKNPGAIKLTKVKGHATEEMVQKGEVAERDKECNDQADKAADKGVVDEQGPLSYMGWKYVARMKAYTRFMGRIHQFIIKVRKGQKAFSG